MKAILVRTDTGMSVVEMSDNPSFAECAKLIECEWIEIVRPCGCKYVLIVDSDGLMHEEWHINFLASDLYGFFEHGSPIAGHAIIMKEEFVGGEPTLVGFTDEEVSEAYKELAERYRNLIASKKFRDFLDKVIGGD